MSRPTDEEHRERVAAFVVRCRRVTASPFAQDWDDRTLSDFRFEPGSEGRINFVRWRPDEARLESVVARMRPLLLQEDTHYSKGLASVKALTGWETKGLRKRWDAVVNGRRYEVGRRSEDDEGLETWNDRDAAESFLYGDLVHGFDRPTAADLEERFFATYQLAVSLLKITQETLHIVWQSRTHLGMDDHQAWTIPVSVGPRGWTRKAGRAIYGAPEGSEYQADPSTPIGPGWTPLG